MRRPFFRPLVSPASKDGKASRLANSSMNIHQRRLRSSVIDRTDVIKTSAHAETRGFMADAISSRQLINRLPPSGSSSQERIEKLPDFMLVCSDNLFESTKRALESALLASFDPVNRDSASVSSKKSLSFSGASMVHSRKSAMMSVLPWRYIF